MSFSLYHTQGAIPRGVISWPGSKLHGKIFYVSKHKPQSSAKVSTGIPPHLRATKDEIKELEDECIGFGDKAPSKVLGTDFFKYGDHDTYLRKGDLAVLGDVLDNGGDLEEYDEEYKERPEVKSFMAQKLDDAKKELASRTRDFNVGSGTIKLCVNPYEREAIFIVGPSGCGKSTMAADLMISYAKTYPENPIYLISKVQNDPAFKGIDFIQQPLDDDFVAQVNSGEGDNLKDCMVVFDDVDTISSEKVRRAVWKLRRDLLQTGRHGSVYVLNTGYDTSSAFLPCKWCTHDLGHEYRAHEQTKSANKESTSVIMFPDGESYGVTDYCKVYGGLNKKQIERIFRMTTSPYSWVCLSRRSPKHILHNHGGYFLESPAEEAEGPPKKKRHTAMFE